FYACSNETCDFVAWNKPVNETCPECGYVGAEMKFTKARGDFRKCLKCGNEWDAPKTEEAGEAGAEAEPALAGWPASGPTPRRAAGLRNLQRALDQRGRLVRHAAAVAQLSVRVIAPAVDLPPGDRARVLESRVEP